ncbi:hypothetical protein pb186bvf_018481 [Paramecium bursaria]
MEFLKVQFLLLFFFLTNLVSSLVVQYIFLIFSIIQSSIQRTNEYLWNDITNNIFLILISFYAKFTQNYISKSNNQISQVICRNELIYNQKRRRPPTSQTKYIFICKLQMCHQQSEISLSGQVFKLILIDTTRLTLNYQTYNINSFLPLKTYANEL